MADDSHSSFSLSSLLCQETGTCFDEEEDVVVVVVGEEEEEEDDVSMNLGSYNVSDDDYVEVLLDREKTSDCFRNGEDECLEMSNWVKFARLDAIEWILKTRAFFGFQFQTAYLSMTYFDRFLARRAIDSEKPWAIRLLSVACLSLAAKMEECKVPALSEFEFEDYNFESRVIQRMELMVLNTLEWRMNWIAPFDFIHYFVARFSEEMIPPTNVVSRTVELILAIMNEINLMDHRPSVIAAAATLVTLDQRLTREALECKINAITSCGFLEIEDLYSCYDTMRKLQSEKHQIPKSIISPDLSPIHFSRSDVYESSSITTPAINTKRKRLTYNGCDLNDGMPDEKRHRL